MSINFIENPMFSPEKDQKDAQATIENGREEKIGAANTKSESQLDLIVDDEKNHFDSVKNFAQAFFNRFKFILHIKTALLLAVIIMMEISVDVTRLDWVENKWPNWQNSFPINVYRYTSDFTADFASLIILFVLYTIVSIVFWKSKAHKYLHSSVAVSNFCLSLLTLPLLLRTFVVFVIRSAAEWTWYYPRFTNSSMTLQDVLQWPEKPDPNRWSDSSRYDFPSRWTYDDYRHRYDEKPTTTTTTTKEPTTTTAQTFSDYEFAEMARKRAQIFVRLALDPTISALLFVALFLAILSIFRYRRLVKSTGLWSSDYRRIYSAEMSSEQDATYAKFWPVGLAKIVHWFIPGIVLLGMVNGVFRVPYSYNYNNNGMMCLLSLIVCWALCFTNWLAFVRMTRFRGLVDVVEKKSTSEGDSKEGQQHHRLAKLWTIDFILVVAQIILYFVLLTWLPDAQVLFALGALTCAVHGLFVLIFVKPKFSNGKNGTGTCFGLNIPSVSISVTINIDKGNCPKGVGGADEKESAAIV